MANGEETNVGHGKHDHGDHADYENALRDLQIGLSRMQRQVIAEGRRLLVIVEGRDAAGKDGLIKRVAEHMSPRDTRVVALGVPTERDRRAWYFQRWVRQLPVSGEIALFNRSWYNRAGVERVMGFCTDEEYEEFMETVVMFEQMLAHSGFTILKYYLDVSKKEQRRRLKDRDRDPLKQWKISDLDRKAQKLWNRYSDARNAMLARTHSVFAPWVVVRADDKQATRLAVIRDILARCGCTPRDGEALPDPSVAFVYDRAALDKGWLAD
jgi:polyphosphate kinase 2